MYKGCIFDLDGTLTDTLDSLVYSVNATLREMNLKEITREQCRAYVGNGARVLMEKSIETVGGDVDEQIEEGMRIYGRIFDENCMYRVAPYEGIVELLKSLKEQGLYISVLSNKPHAQTVHVVETIFGTDIFSTVQGQQEGIPRKPDPGAAIVIAEKLQIDPSECVYIGDSEVDIATGTSAGMKTIGVTWGFRSKEELLDAGAVSIVDHPLQILEILK